MQTDDVQDATQPEQTDKYGLVAYCTFEVAPAFTIPNTARGGKVNMALAIVTKLTPSSKPQHTADLFIEDMRLVSSEAQEETRDMIRDMQQLTTSLTMDALSVVVGKEVPWKQSKCRKLSRYPTDMNV